MRCEEVISIFPDMLREVICQMKFSTEYLQEIRIRAERPLLILCGGKEYWSARKIPGSCIKEILAYLGNYSLYAYEDEIRQGFLSLPGGHRVGLTGKVILEGQRIKTISEISSLNIRFAHEVKGCAGSILPFLWQGEKLCHTLIVSAPGKGKTTLLRDCIRQISDGNTLHQGKTVAVVDERSEIAGSFRGIPGNDMGMRTDVLEGYSKAEGMMLMIRSMAPEVIAVDELGSEEDLLALQYAMHCGCVLLATVHGNSMEELKNKPSLRKMIEEAMFERYVFLESKKGPGQIGKILDGEGREVAVEKC